MAENFTATVNITGDNTSSKTLLHATQGSGSYPNAGIDLKLVGWEGEVGLIDSTGALASVLSSYNNSYLFANSASGRTNGKFGIGTSSPNASVHICGVGTASAVGDETNPALQIGNAGNYRFGVYTTAEGATVENKNGDDGVRFVVKTAGEAMRIDGGTGRVGIGTSSPQQALHVYQAGDGQTPVQFNTGNDEPLVFYNDTEGWDIKSDQDLNLTTYNGSSFVRVLKCDSNSNVTVPSGSFGIGTSSPTEKLHINGGGIKMLGSSHSSSISMAGSDGTVDGFLYSVTDSIGFLDSGGDWGIEYDNDTAIKFSLSGGSEKMTILANGSVGIGDTSPSYKLEVAGTFYASGSSANFKKNVTDLAVDSSAIYNLNPVSYNYKKDYENFGYDLAEGKQFGLISEEVAEAVPELAIMKDGEPKNVDYQKLSVLLLAEMQKMNKRIKDLECHI